MAELNQRMQVIERSQSQWQANSVAARLARDQSQNELKEKINKNSNDINILFATKKDK